MPAKVKREKQRQYARDLYEKYSESICPNCGIKGKHFAPPSLGEAGFFTCKEDLKFNFISEQQKQFFETPIER